MIARVLALSLAIAFPAHENAGARTAPRFQSLAPEAGAAAARVPFGVGERLVFDVRFGNLKVGTSQMQVVGLEMVRGREAWHTSFRLQGGTFFYKVNDRFESWIDTRTLSSLMFTKELEEGSREREQHFEIFPERSTYIERSKKDATEQRSVREPLDDGSFLYFVRTIPLKTGETYDFNRYFIPDRNPVRIKVLRRERVKVPAGTFNAVVVQPIIKTRGIFAEKGHAEVWLSDDSARMILQLRSRLSFGSLNLFLTSYTLAKTQRAAMAHPAQPPKPTSRSSALFP
ncbi:MAG TPA: DUF3108 domain-containing protein [Gemmatimonadaceae bacterium]|nr:DUF3108 domain-containing protein [Gemmatimonadaceae bacterium]